MTDTLAWYTVEVFVNILDAALSVYFLSKMLRDKNKTSKFIAYVLFTVIITGINLFSLDISVNMLITTALLFLCSLFLFDGNTHVKLFYTLTLDGVVVLSETIVSLVLLAFTDVGVNQMAEPGFHRIIGIILSKILFFVLIKILIILKNNKNDKTPLKYWLALMIVPTVNILTAILLFQIDWQFIKETVSLPLLTVVSVGILFVNVLVFFLFENFANASKLSESNNLMQQQIKLQAAHYNEVYIEQQETRKLWHDMNNHIICLQQMQADGNFGSVSKYINELSESLERSHLPCNTGISVIDTIVNIKYQYAKVHGIDMQITASFSKTDVFSQMDMCTIISNILDNAIEECLNTDNKQIQFSITEKKHYLVIRCSNPISEQSKSKKRILDTNKANPSAHGIGLKNVELAAKKYNGNMTVDIENGFFTIIITMCLDKI